MKYEKKIVWRNTKKAAWNVIALKMIWKWNIIYMKKEKAIWWASRKWRLRRTHLENSYNPEKRGVMTSARPLAHQLRIEINIWRNIASKKGNVSAASAQAWRAASMAAKKHQKIVCKRSTRTLRKCIRNRYARIKMIMKEENRRISKKASGKWWRRINNLINERRHKAWRYLRRAQMAKISRGIGAWQNALAHRYLINPRALRIENRQHRRERLSTAAFRANMSKSLLRASSHQHKYQRHGIAGKRAWRQ